MPIYTACLEAVKSHLHCREFPSPLCKADRMLSNAHRWDLLPFLLQHLLCGAPTPLSHPVLARTIDDWGKEVSQSLPASCDHPLRSWEHAVGTAGHRKLCSCPMRYCTEPSPHSQPYHLPHHQLRYPYSTTITPGLVVPNPTTQQWWFHLGLQQLTQDFPKCSQSAASSSGGMQLYCCSRSLAAQQSPLSSPARPAWFSRDLMSTQVGSTNLTDCISPGSGSTW